MKKRHIIFLKLSILFIILSFCTPLRAQEEFSVDDIKPIKTATSNSYVSNQDNILSEATCQKLNSQLASLEKKTSAQVDVVVLQTSGGENARDISMEIFNKWKVGNKNANNGLIIMLLVKERQVFFRTGYGLEGAITDAKATDITNDIMAPYLKEGKWDEGIIAGVDAAQKLIINEYNTEGFAKEGKAQDTIPTLLYMYLAISIILLIFSIILIHTATSKFNIDHKEEKISAFQKRMRPLLFASIIFP